MKKGVFLRFFEVEKCKMLKTQSPFDGGESWAVIVTIVLQPLS